MDDGDFGRGPSNAVSSAILVALAHQVVQIRLGQLHVAPHCPQRSQQWCYLQRPKDQKLSPQLQDEIRPLLQPAVLRQKSGAPAWDKLTPKSKS
ncbi:MAG: hypothetical protein FRX49_07139 [Trebouxia sp. A1-2]|nr:MAG: hypothetical protein FRX49_07139 [Trebouxia sp. A1-2]